jgi:hypothetical protein
MTENSAGKRTRNLVAQSTGDVISGLGHSLAIEIEKKENEKLDYHKREYNSETMHFTQAVSIEHY